MHNLDPLLQRAQPLSPLDPPPWSLLPGTATTSAPPPLDPTLPPLEIGNRKKTEKWIPKISESVSIRSNYSRYLFVRIRSVFILNQHTSPRPPPPPPPPRRYATLHRQSIDLCCCCLSSHCGAGTVTVKVVACIATVNCDHGLQSGEGRDNGCSSLCSRVGRGLHGSHVLDVLSLSWTPTVPPFHCLSYDVPFCGSGDLCSTTDAYIWRHHGGNPCLLWSVVRATITGGVCRNVVDELYCGEIREWLICY